MTRNTHLLAEDHRGAFIAPPFAEQPDDPATPASGMRLLYAKADGIFEMDDTGAVTGPLGGGGGCAHQHVTEEFTATGGSPETFTLADTPLWARNVYVEGLRVAPADVGGTGVSVEVNTSASDVVVIDYEAECVAPPPSGPLAFPGEAFVVEGWTNALASFEAVGPGYVTIILTLVDGAWEGNGFAVVDDAGVPSTDWWDFSTSGFDTQTATVGTFYLPVPAAGSWHIATADPGADNAGTYEVHYPGTPTDSLAFPGVDIGGNQIGDFTTTDPVILFVSIEDPLPVDVYLGISQTDDGDEHYVNLPVAAGTYVFYFDHADDWLIYTWNTGYDAGLTNTGTYELVVLP